MPHSERLCPVNYARLYSSRPRRRPELTEVVHSEKEDNFRGRVTDKGFISFAAEESRGAGTAERRESDETAR
jgi:hypothetical protein